MLLKIVGQCLTDSLLNSAVHLGVTELCLCLTLKLRLGNLYGDNGCQSLLEVLAGNLYLCFLYLL